MRSLAKIDAITFKPEKGSVYEVKVIKTSWILERL